MLEPTILPSTDPDVDAEGDAFLRRLTDALQAGPGSTEWDDAVAEAKARGEAGDGESLLLAARERLAEGRAFRSVRAGPGFERKLMARVGAGGGELQPRRSPLSPGLFAILGVGVAVGAVGLLLAILFRSGSGEVTGQSDLAHAYFQKTFASATLTDALPPGWRSIGSLSLDPTKRLALGDKPLGPAYAGGGLATRSGFPADEPMSVQATFHFNHVGPGCVPQLFVSDGNDFDASRGTGTHELVWLVQDGQGQTALADARVADPRVKVHDRDDVAVKIVVAPGGDAAVVCNGQVLWTGASLLADRPRFAGVRLLYRSGDRRDAVTVTGLKVLQK